MFFSWGSGDVKDSSNMMWLQGSKE